MVENDQARDWARRYLDLWERHLIASSDDPAGLAIKAKRHSATTDTERAESLDLSERPK